MDIVVQIAINSLVASALYCLLALGFNLIFSTVKFFDIGYGALTAVGGYGAFFVLKTLGLPFWLALIIGVLCAGLIGVLVYFLVYRFLRARNASPMVMLVASLGVLTMVQSVIAMLFTSQFKTLSRGSAETFHVFGGVITSVQIGIIAASVLVALGLALWLEKTRFGKAVQAIGDDEEVASIVGINTKKVIIAVFFVGSSIAGLSGVLVGLDTGIEPTMGLSLLLKGVIVALIGGVGNVYGGVLGALLLGFSENVGVWFLSGEWKDAIAFVVLIVFLLWRPQGILGTKEILK